MNILCECKTSTIGWDNTAVQPTVAPVSCQQTHVIEKSGSEISAPMLRVNNKVAYFDMAAGEIILSIREGTEANGYAP